MDIRRPDTGRRRYRRIAVGGVGVAAGAALLAVAFSLAGRPPAVASDGLWSASVVLGEFVHEITGSGTLIATDLRAVTNRSEGVVEAIRALPGQQVSPDDVLITMSSPQLEEDLADARSDLEAAQAEEIQLLVDLENRYLDMVAAVSNAEVEYTSARLELQAQEQLGLHQTVPEIEVRRAGLRVEQLQRRLEAEQARLGSYDQTRSAQETASSARLSRAARRVSTLERRVEDLDVRAGMHGVVQEINAEAGERLGAGQAVARIVNPENLIARVRVSERDAARVHPGMSVRLELGTQVLAGEVTRVDPTVRDRLVTVDIELTGESPATLRPDLSVTARIELERVDNALILERPVNVREHDELDLFRLNGRGGAERVAVRTGRASARYIEILDGLAVGDRIILADMSDWLQEAQIRIR